MTNPLTPQQVVEAREPDYDAEMRLPDGLTCADCRHIARCKGFGFSEPERTSCDFWPSRFLKLKGAEHG